MLPSSNLKISDQMQILDLLIQRQVTEKTRGKPTKVTCTEKSIYPNAPFHSINR